MKCVRERYQRYILKNVLYCIDIPITWRYIVNYFCKKIQRQMMGSFEIYYGNAIINLLKSENTSLI